MGKKYIIDLNPDCVEGEYLRIPARIAGEEQWLVTKAALTPYTEPDLKRVRKDAYEYGYNAGFGRKIDASYQEGLSDAWEACRKIVCYEIDGGYPVGHMLNLFERDDIPKILSDYTASEAIEKIRQYEQRQEEQIQVGDEVELKCGVSPAIYMQGTKRSDEIYLLFKDGSCGLHSKSEIERKTGRHFPEIATILEKMKEEQDGQETAPHSLPEGHGRP